MLRSYFPILLFLILTGATAAVMVFLSWFMARRPDSGAGRTPYECGMEPTGGAERKFSIRFYVIAMMFIIFDIEAAFLYPWALIFKKQALFAFVEMMVFLLILFVGYLYLWRKGALEWT